MEALGGRLSQAWKSSQAGLDLFWQGTYDPERGYAFYQNLKSQAELREQWHLTFALQREALLLIEQTARKGLWGTAHFYFGVAAQRLGQADEAARHLAVAQAIFHQLPPEATNLAFQAAVELALARLEVSQGHLQDASARLSSVEPFLKETSNTHLQLDYWTVKAEIEQFQGHKDKEVAYWGRVVKIGNEGFQSLGSPAERWDWRRKVGLAYARLLELELDEPHDPAQALADWESFRAAEHRKKFNGSAIQNAEAKMELLARLRTLRRSTLIGFAAAGTGIHGWVADDRGVWEAPAQGSLDTMRSEIEEFYRLCSNPRSPGAEINRVGSGLYRRLFGPLEQYLDPQRTLFIEADDPLNGIAWAALTMRNGRYLSEVYALVSTPGLLYQAPSPEAAVTELALIADPGAATFQGERYLPVAVAQEESQILAHIAPETLYLKGESANLHELLRRLPQAAIFHFVGHAVAMEQGGELLLAGGEGNAALSARSLAGMTFHHCRLVVLAACSTAAASQDITRNPDGLIPAFLQSGAHRVVASHWDVDSSATFQLMQQFYGFLGKAESVAAALRNAQAQVRSQPLTSAPYYWASFEAFGPAD